MTLRNIWIWAIPAVLLISCGAPIFMSEQRRFQPEPELIQELQPYLERWAVNPPEVTEAERRMVGERLNIGIGVGIWSLLNQQGTTPAVRIGIEARGDWSRGYLYIHEGVDIETEVDGWDLRKIDDHFYIYNRID